MFGVQTRRFTSGVWRQGNYKLRVEFGMILRMLRYQGMDPEFFCLHWGSIQAWSILTGELISEVELEYSSFYGSLIVDGLRVWVYSNIGGIGGFLGWDFGISGSYPIQLSTTAPLYLNNTILWGDDQSKIRNTVTGKILFQLGGKFVRPVDPQWDGRYLVAGYDSGEVLILDFNHALL